MLDAALEYARAGWKVFPLAEGKTPITEHAYLDATSDEHQIRAWWSATPNAWIGVALRPSGLVCVDVDPRNGGDITLRGLEQAHGALPRACNQRSRSGGEHIIMCDPSPGPDGWTRTHDAGGNARGKLGPGVDLKINGYIVLYPSPGYEWLRTEAVPAVPAVWVDLMRKRAVTAEVGTVEAWDTTVRPLDERDAAKLTELLAELGPRGAGKSTTYQALKLIHHDYGLSVVDGAVFRDGWNANNGKPLDSHEMQRQIERVASNVGDDRPRGWCADLESAFADDEIAMLVEATAAWQAEIAQRKAPVVGTWEHDLAQALLDVQAALGTSTANGAREPLFVPACDLFARSYGATPWLVQGVITRGGLAVLGAEPKVGKTWIATEVAVAVATGTRACGEFQAQCGAVAYFYAEDLDVQVRNRLRALLAGRGMTPAAIGNLHVCPRGRFLDVTRDDDLALVIASCRRLGKLDLLVLDPLRDIHSGEEDKSDSMGPVMRRLRAIGEILGCTVAIAHHASKPSGDTQKRRPGQKLRGSSAIYGSTDSGIYVGLRGGDGASRFEIEADVEVKGARSAGHVELVLEVEDDGLGEAVRATWQVSKPVKSDAAPGDDMTKVETKVLAKVKALAALPKDENARSQLLNKTDLKKAVGGKATVTAEAIGNLIARGVLRQRDEAYQEPTNTPNLKKERTRTVVDFASTFPVPTL